MDEDPEVTVRRVETHKKELTFLSLCENARKLPCEHVGPSSPEPRGVDSPAVEEDPRQWVTRFIETKLASLEAAKARLSFKRCNLFLNLRTLIQDADDVVDHIQQT
jgi:hypothetical protein